MGIVATFLVGYVVLFYPRITRNPMRLLAICSLVSVMLGLTALVGARAPNLVMLAAVAPTIFVSIVALLAYDQRIALFLSAIQSALATLALGQGVGMFILLFAGCGVAVAQLREMRHRSTIIQASSITAAILAGGAILVGLLETPIVPGVWKQILLNGFWAGFGGFAVGFVILGILPTIERWFDITAGMTLAELRDPKQPLLKQLQQKAPGTYNHSLQVANIAEAASEAIGANGLLVYVGALYHDIGKMNKPDDFVENQTSGPSRHDKLSPAMSLLVIVGHVKDGIELAREYGLPRQIQHFIESHHGTTLVEYFYHAAKNQSEDGNVQEIEFRYPGPKPRTREAAIIMLSDAVESATRSMADPNPSRIDGLVHKLSLKRLVDGQYDQCDLTFRELGLIEISMIKSLCAIYHGRISYPSQKEDEKKEAAAATGATPPPEPVPAKQATA
jgi:putative nucleotidyltransferase with HDIG domain